MKKYILLFLLLVSLACEAQITKYRADYFALKTADQTTKEFTDWSDWYDSNVLITEEDDVIHIYSEEEQKYDIISDKQDFIGIEDRKITKFVAIDEEGYKCIIEIVKFKNGNYHLYIRWEALEMVYQMKKV